MCIRDSQIKLYSRRPEICQETPRAASPSRQIRLTADVDKEEAAQRLLALSSLLQMLTLVHASSTTLCISWPHVALTGQELPTYQLRLQSSPGAVSEVVALVEPEEYTDPATSLLQRGRIVYTLMGLEPAKAYSLRVQGGSYSSDQATFKTASH
eukprot:TRINITY_DN63562_c0_g1_i1.p1 TRINITY_DN63562_c0_g1~~TRINITY_DN63562_c0_g1_i1.p1  ORF type:complete len:154 (-),score=36.70 TRINITY_DN63562_c0_g1_i1:291-752(-)